MMKGYKNIIGISVLALAMAACGSKENDVVNHENETYCLHEEFKEDIQTARPMFKSMIREIPLTGLVEANPDNVLQFINLVDGVIVSTNFSLGDFVNKGQVLAKVKSAELSELRAQAEILASELKVAQEKYNAEKAMFEDGISSTKALNQVKSEVQVIQAELNKINEHKDLYNASTESGVFLIKAPSSGYITEKNISPGAHVSAYGNPLFTISELDEVWVQVNIYSANIQDIQQGMPVKVHSTSYPDLTFEGKIDAISHILDSEARVLKARVQLANKDLKLKPGMFVDVMAIQETKEEAVAIPTDALIFDDNQNFIVIYHNDCDIEIQKVDLISESKGTSYIQGNIEDEHKTIIVQNQLLIYEQLKNFKK